MQIFIHSSNFHCAPFLHLIKDSEKLQPRKTKASTPFQRRRKGWEQGPGPGARSCSRALGPGRVGTRGPCRSKVREQGAASPQAHGTTAPECPADRPARPIVSCLPRSHRMAWGPPGLRRAPLPPTPGPLTRAGPPGAQGLTPGGPRPTGGTARTLAGLWGHALSFHRI